MDSKVPKLLALSLIATSVAVPDVVKRHELEQDGAMSDMSLAEVRRKFFDVETLKTRRELDGLYTTVEEIEEATGIKGGQLPCLKDGNVPYRDTEDGESESRICRFNLEGPSREALEAFFHRRREIQLAREEGYQFTQVDESFMDDSVRFFIESGWNVKRSGSEDIYFDVSSVDERFDFMSVTVMSVYIPEVDFLAHEDSAVIAYRVLIGKDNFDRLDQASYIVDTKKEVQKKVVEWFEKEYR